MTNKHRPKSAGRFANRSKQGTSIGARPEPRGSGNAQRNYERYLTLTRAQAPSRPYSWGRKLLPARRALFQIDVPRSRNDMRDLQGCLSFFFKIDKIPRGR